MALSRTLYAAFVSLLAFSPLLSLILPDAFGRPIGGSNWLTFMWVGVALSLPSTLAAARLAGMKRYCAYWHYLESFPGPGNSKRTIIAAWATGTVVMTAIGLGALFT